MQTTTTPDSLAAALKAARPDDEITLAPGRYSPITLTKKHSGITLIGQESAVLAGGSDAPWATLRWPGAGWAEVVDINAPNSIRIAPAPPEWPEDGSTEALVLLAWMGLRLPCALDHDHLVLGPKAQRPCHFEGKWEPTLIRPGCRVSLEHRRAAPAAAPILLIDGAENVTIKGLTIENADWPTPEEGARTIDSCFLKDSKEDRDPARHKMKPRTPKGNDACLPEAAVEVRRSASCKLLGLKIRDVRGTGLGIIESTNIIVNGCRVEDAGCGGVVACERSTAGISDVRIIRPGRCLPSSPGFAVVEAAVNADRIAVIEAPWSAFRVGSGPHPRPQKPPTYARLNRCTAESCGFILGDGAAFYMYGDVDAVLQDCIAQDVRVPNAESMSNAGFFLDHVKGGPEAPVFRRCGVAEDALERGAAWRWYPPGQKPGIFDGCGEGQDHPAAGGRRYRVREKKKEAM